MKISTQILMSAMLLYIAIKDAKTQRIEHRDCQILSVLVLLALLTELASPQNISGAGWLADHMLGGMIVSVPMLILTMIKKGSIGGGDIRLVAIGGVWLGTADIWQAFSIGICFAAIYAITLYLRKKDKKIQFALGPFLCAGMLAVQVMG